MCLELKPDIAVLDYALPLVNGIEATRQIHARLPRTEMLIFTMHDNETFFRDLLAAGARGFLLKSDASRFLLAAIDRSRRTSRSSRLKSRKRCSTPSSSDAVTPSPC